MTPALTDAILHAPPVAPGRLRPELSPALEGIILRCLEKDPAFRYQSAGDLLADLRRVAARSSVMALPVPSPPAKRRFAARWGLPAAAGAILAVAAAAVGLNLLDIRERIFGGGSAQRIQSLAVLPLDNFSRDPAQEAFVAGMTEALTAAVAQIPTLRVIGRTSAMQFAAAKSPIPEIARTLGVDAVVEGSVLREGSRVRITAQLVGVRPERHLWANTFDREMKDVLAIHSEVAQAIAREIRATLAPDTQARLSRPGQVDPAAYEAYLRGRSFFTNPVPQAYGAAEAALNEAISLDPGFAPAYASLAYVQVMAAVLSGGPPRAAASRARVSAAKALELDPAQPEALAVEGTLNLYFDWNWAAAERRLRRALELNPSESLLYHPYADYLLVTGQLEESLEYTRRGAALEPLSPAVNVVVGGHLSFLRRYEEAAAALRPHLERHPELPLLHNMLGSVLWLKGDHRAALGELFRAPGPTRDAAMSGFAAAGSGGKTTALFHLARQLAPAIVTTTTHLGEWQTPLADRHVVWSAEVGAADIGDEVGGGVTLVTGSLDEATRRYRAPSRLAIEGLRELARARAVAALIEADGARQRPLKAPAAHEPVIPEGVGTVLVVAGLTAVGHALDDTIVHRTEFFTRLSGLRPGDEVTPSALAKVATHPDGGLKGIPPQARPVILLNQADTPALHAVGTEIARSVVPPYQAAVVARLHEPSLVFEVRERVAGIVLAAGASRRFGRPKQVLPYRGRPFVRVVAETALAAGLSPVHVVTGADAARVEEALADLPVLVVRNPEWENGQGTSVRAGTSALPDEVGAAVFLLADQPQVSAAIVRALIDRHASDLPAVVVPTVNGRRANPVLFDRVAFRDLLLLTGDAGGRAVWSRHDLTEVPWSDEALLVDVDTPTDYERLLGEQ